MTTKTVAFTLLLALTITTLATSEANSSGAAQQVERYSAWRSTGAPGVLRHPPKRHEGRVRDCIYVSELFQVKPDGSETFLGGVRLDLRSVSTDPRNRLGLVLKALEAEALRADDPTRQPIPLRAGSNVVSMPPGGRKEVARLYFLSDEPGTIIRERARSRAKERIARGIATPSDRGDGSVSVIFEDRSVYREYDGPGALAHMQSFEKAIANYQEKHCAD